MRLLVFTFIAIVTISCKQNEKDNSPFTADWPHDYQAIGLLGDTLRPSKPSEKVLQEYAEKRKAYEAKPDSLDLLIWYGRFAAYKGSYHEAIAIYTTGLEQFDEKARLLRHRGHRYITIREFKKAIADLEQAAALINGKPNSIEEDGMPNEKNIPISTLHGNIYYHLGLAYYLDRQMIKSLDAFKKGLSTSNDADNVVACTHWIYMIQNRLGRKAAGDNYLRNIHENMPIIENESYYKACLFYKGLLKWEDLYNEKIEPNASNSALLYALGNWAWYMGNQDIGKEIFEIIINGGDWASFGYIAAETDIAKPYVFR